ncbi:exodeoxyribonuclease V subunit alpha [Cocleimonas sp. KMM 6892]|uniref:exodeoxyribonuclease V subunit alpha n=1 Tax=unclassified Cocleimonas TaxID=2639732 RepID=UPI002DB80ED6|nr:MULTISPECIES: exodeoxyribonuclease V subunit alpha [unclassified Cocleimonas]MEB8434028.1 exodeoxyribonuclease V subunit alpha [Cocleimonas sp. KMM 6892]MEC4716839.1 exodeoxyribonuclease V subunit alpha [Cocleimonas sp. KMM 6895]MEC4746006.1 exodeoxyribonuclease V subunit alpha [Cocleimonas sp. KMM 6896]
MSEQLSMFGDSADSKKDASDVLPETVETPSTNLQQQAPPEAEEYEALDKQLAELMQELNSSKDKESDLQIAQNKVIKRCTLEISKHTREGQIAIPVSEEDQAVLLQTNVGGEAGDYKPLIIDQGYLYLRRYWQYQNQLAKQIRARMTVDEDIDSNTKSSNQDSWAQQRLDELFSDDEDSENEKESKEINWQRRAVELALKHQFLIVSGGPGTGKTTTITRLLALLIEQHLSPSDEKTAPKVGGGLTNSFKVLLAAPTGKAAIRMLDSIRDAQAGLGLTEDAAALMPSEASTIHKLLGYQHGSVNFKHNRNNPLNADVVLVDEASMIDIALMSKLVEAVPAHAKLILIGDKDQLSSVETGSVFADMCSGLEEDKSEHLVTLKKNWRFSKDSDIGQSAIAANQGDSRKLLSLLKDSNSENCKLIAPDTLRDAELIKPWRMYIDVINNPDASYDEIFQAFNQYRVLCALRRGPNGSVNMSSRIETALAKQNQIHFRKKFSNNNQSWYHGRPIMITQNSYGKGLFNGDTGITLIRDGEVKVYFPSADKSGEHAYKSFSPVRLPAHETTWAMTIHKSQGSEFNQVVLILPHEEMPLLTRQLIYTGITRAKEQVSIVASESVLVTGVKAEVVKATRIEQSLSNA